MILEKTRCKKCKKMIDYEDIVEFNVDGSSCVCSRCADVYTSNAKGRKKIHYRHPIDKNKSYCNKMNYKLEFTDKWSNVTCNNCTYFKFQLKKCPLSIKDKDDLFKKKMKNKSRDELIEIIKELLK